MRHRAIGLAIVAAALTAPTASMAQKKPAPLDGEAKATFDRALADFNRKDYKAAAAGFGAVYQLTPRIDVLFAWAQSSRLSGDCAAALELYRQLERDPDLADRDRVAVDSGIRKCGAEPNTGDEEPDAVDEPETGDDRAIATPPPATVETAAAQPWYTDGLGDALMAAGVVTAGFGAGLFVVSASDAGAAETAATEADHIRFEQRARTRRALAIASVSVGSALIGGAVYRYLTRDTGGSANLALWTSPGAMGLSVRSGF